MDIQKYFEKLNNESQDVFRRSKLEKEKLGTLHHLSSCVYEFSECVIDPQERKILETLCVQLEAATFNLALGLYRQAFSSLRLALEMGLAAIYFSSNKVELHEWLDGRMDIKWYLLTDEDNGVLSKRFVKAFFADLTDQVDDYRNKAIYVYRKLSEYVHGNSETWESGIKFVYNTDLFNKYFEYYKTVTEVILFASICRYTKTFHEASRESLQLGMALFQYRKNLVNTKGLANFKTIFLWFEQR
jgi:hypothetical protein